MASMENLLALGASSSRIFLDNLHSLECHPWKSSLSKSLTISSRFNLGDALSPHHLDGALLAWKTNLYSQFRCHSFRCFSSIFMSNFSFFCLYNFKHYVLYHYPSSPWICMFMQMGSMTCFNRPSPWLPPLVTLIFIFKFDCYSMGWKPPWDADIMMDLSSHHDLVFFISIKLYCSWNQICIDCGSSIGYMNTWFSRWCMASPRLRVLWFSISCKSAFILPPCAMVLFYFLVVLLKIQEFLSSFSASSITTPFDPGVILCSAADRDFSNLSAKMFDSLRLLKADSNEEDPNFYLPLYATIILDEDVEAFGQDAHIQDAVTDLNNVNIGNYEVLFEGVPSRKGNDGDVFFLGNNLANSDMHSGQIDVVSSGAISLPLFSDGCNFMDWSSPTPLGDCTSATKLIVMVLPNVLCSSSSTLAATFNEEVVTNDVGNMMDFSWKIFEHLAPHIGPPPNFFTPIISVIVLDMGDPKETDRVAVTAPNSPILINVLPCFNDVTEQVGSRSIVETAEGTTKISEYNSEDYSKVNEASEALSKTKNSILVLALNSDDETVLVEPIVEFSIIDTCTVVETVLVDHAGEMSNAKACIVGTAAESDVTSCEIAISRLTPFKIRIVGVTISVVKCDFDDLKENVCKTDSMNAIMARCDDVFFNVEVVLTKEAEFHVSKALLSILVVGVEVFSVFKSPLPPLEWMLGTSVGVLFVVGESDHCKDGLVSAPLVLIDLAGGLCLYTWITSKLPVNKDDSHLKGFVAGFNVGVDVGSGIMITLISGSGNDSKVLSNFGLVVSVFTPGEALSRDKYCCG